MASSQIREFRYLVLHHSASSLSTTLEDIRGWHLGRGWRDVGYHWVIEGDGTVRRGRPLPEVGAHARGVNDRSIGICVVGDMTSEDQRWTRAQVFALAELVRTVLVLFPEIEIVGHREVGTTRTACPGVDLGELLVA